MELRYRMGTRYILTATFGIIFICLSYLLHVFHPSKLIVAQMTTFTSNSQIFNLWKAPPYEVFINIYVFNVTNPEQFLKGEEKIRVQEVGPYSYRESLYNIHTTFNDNGTLSFIPKRKIEFSLNNSIGNASVDRFTLPNLAFLGLASYLHSSSIFTKAAFSSYTSYLGSEPFLNLTVEEYLLGYDDPLVKLANNFLPNWIDFERIGILDRVMALDNSSDIVTINIKPELDYSVVTNEKNIPQYAIQRWAHSPGLSYWGYDEHATSETNSKCNVVEGAYMGTIFPSNIDTDQTIRMYRKAFCRIIPFQFHSNGLSKDGFETHVYKVDPNYLLRKEYNPENSCYCQSSNSEDCAPNGVGDMSPCYYGIPISMSPPHFLDIEPAVSEKIDGLHPNREQHEMIFELHPQMGIPLEVHMRTQINLLISDTSYNSKTKPFSNHLLPLLWIDLNVQHVPSSVKFFITFLYSVLPTTEQILMYVFGVLGVLLFSYSSIAGTITLKNNSKNPNFKHRYSPLLFSSFRQKRLDCSNIS